METKTQRINKLINHLGISKNQFAKEIGTSSAMISKITTKDINFGADIIEKIISRYPDVNPVWLLTGKGSPTFTEINAKSKGSFDDSMFSPEFSAQDLFSFYDFMTSNEQLIRVWDNEHKMRRLNQEFQMHISSLLKKPIADLMREYIKTNNSKLFFVLNKERINSLISTGSLIEDILKDFDVVLQKVRKLNKDGAIEAFWASQDLTGEDLNDPKLISTYNLFLEKFQIKKNKNKPEKN